MKSRGHPITVVSPTTIKKEKKREGGENRMKGTKTACVSLKKKIHL